MSENSTAGHSRAGNIQRFGVSHDTVREEEYRLKLADGRTLACLALGEPDGKPVLYCHGYPGSRLEARLAAGAVRRQGLRVLAPDRPGFGASSFLPGRTIGNWTRDVSALADQLGLERFPVVGVSGGGPYALACAAGLGRRVTGVGLVGALGPVNRRPLRRGMVPLNRLVLAMAARFPSAAIQLVRLMALWVRRHPEHYLSLMKAGAPAADRRVLDDPDYHALILASMAEALHQGGRGPAWEVALIARPWDFELENVRAPVMIWQGLADTIVPEAMARFLETALQESESHYFPGEGHLSLIIHRIDDVLIDLCA